VPPIEKSNRKIERLVDIVCLLVFLLGDFKEQACAPRIPTAQQRI